MPKKFFDIIPPKEGHEERHIEKPLESQKRARKKIFEKKPILKGVFLKSSLFLIVSFFVVLIIGFFIFQKTEIEILPITETTIFEGEIVIDLNLEKNDFDLMIMPGKLFEDQRQVQKTFSATGKAETKKKATGVITVYNEYSTSSRTLVPSRFISADGKLFWSTQTITIPGYKTDKGKIIPGEKEVGVEAAEAGQEYNISPTTFALPALAGTSLYTTIYAKSFSPMSGGVVGEVSKITEEDLRSAENLLILEAKEESKKYLSGFLPDGFVLIDEAISQEILEKKFSAESGELRDLFDLEITVKSSGFSFSKSDLDSIVENFIVSKIGAEEDFLRKTLFVDYSLKSDDLSEGKLTLGLEIKAEIFKKTEQEDLKKVLLGKSIEEAEIFLSSFSEEFNFNFKRRPFLKKTIAEDMDKIDIYINFDKGR